MDQEEAKDRFLAAFDEYGDAILRYTKLKVASRELAEDLTQETFTRFWQQLRLGKEIANEKALLYRIARNLVIDWYRKKKEQSLDSMLDAGFEFSGNADEDTVHKAEAREVLGVIAELDEPTREALTLRYVDGFSPADIAELTGETANVISVRIHRGLAKVRERLNIS